MGCCSNCSNCKSAYASSFNPDPCYCCADYFPDSQQPSPQLLPMASSCPSAASARLPVQPPLLRPFSSLFCFLLLCLLFSQLTISQSTPLNQKHSAIANVPWPFLKSVPENWAIGGHRERRSTRRLSSASAEAFPWRKRYYVSRWHRRRFVSRLNEVVDADNWEPTEAQRLCGIRLTNRTRELCGDCAPSNMRRVELMDKKADRSVATKERLTQMCCEKRCTDDQIRDYCCRSQQQR